MRLNTKMPRMYLNGKLICIAYLNDKLKDNCLNKTYAIDPSTVNASYLGDKAYT